MRLSALVSVVACVTPLAWAQDKDLATVKAYFEKYNIPKDLGINFNPVQLLNLYFPQANYGPVSPVPKFLPVTTGDTLPRNATAGPPRFALGGGPTVDPLPGSPGPTYVIIAVDPDAPTHENPVDAQVRYLLGGDFRPSNVITPDPAFALPVLVNYTAAITDYRQPSPPISTLATPHRYIFLAYNQSKAFANQTLVTPKTPLSRWDVAKFAQATGLGDPVGGVFFMVKSDLCGSVICPL